MNVLNQMRGMMGAFNPAQMDYGNIFMDMDVDMEDQLAMMEAMSGDEGPKVKLVDGDFFNSIYPPASKSIHSNVDLICSIFEIDFDDDFDDSDVE